MKNAMLIKCVICVCSMVLTIWYPPTNPAAVALRMVPLAFTSGFSCLAKLDSDDVEGGNASGLTPAVKEPPHSRWKISLNDSGAGVQATLPLILSSVKDVGALAPDRHSTQIEGWKLDWSLKEGGVKGG
jgi:hypothetical protein